MVKMATLKQIFVDLKLAEVETFIASGNVIFTSPAVAARLEVHIEKGLQKALGSGGDVSADTGRDRGGGRAGSVRNAGAAGGENLCRVSPRWPVVLGAAEGCGANHGDGQVRGLRTRAVLALRHPLHGIDHLRRDTGASIGAGGDFAERQHGAAARDEISLHEMSFVSSDGPVSRRGEIDTATERFTNMQELAAALPLISP